jgi:hypothetical protein
MPRLQQTYLDRTPYLNQRIHALPRLAKGQPAFEVTSSKCTSYSPKETGDGIVMVL